MTACLTLGGAACDQGAHTATFSSPEKEAAGRAACLAAGLSDDPNSDTYTHYLDCIFDMIGSDVNLAFIDDYGIVALTQQEEDREVETNGFVPPDFTLLGLPCDDAAQCNGNGVCTDPTSAAAGCVCDAGWTGFNWYVQLWRRLHCMPCPAPLCDSACESTCDLCASAVRHAVRLVACVANTARATPGHTCLRTTSVCATLGGAAYSATRKTNHRLAAHASAAPAGRARRATACATRSTLAPRSAPQGPRSVAL